MIDLSVPSWTNCQVKVSSSNAGNTPDQAFITFALPNSGPPPSTPEVPLAIVLPIGAVGLLAGAYVINRRRHTQRLSA